MERIHKISACVITFNEEANIHRCLGSLTWCDEIVVLDSFSTDNTLALCSAYTENIHQQEWEGYITQRNRSKKLASHEWVLIMDADEEVSSEMREQIQHVLQQDEIPYMGYEFPRQVYYLGRWIKFGEWNPDRKLRFFKKNKGTSGGEEPHDMVFIDGPVKRLSGKIYHYTYTDITDHINQANRFSSLSAEAKFKAGKKFKLSDVILRPSFRFFKSFIFKLGFLDGRRGFMIAVISAFSVTMKYFKLWNMERKVLEATANES